MTDEKYCEMLNKVSEVFESYGWSIGASCCDEENEQIEMLIIPSLNKECGDITFHNKGEIK